MTTAENIEVFLANPKLITSVRENLRFNITPENVVLSVIQGCIHMAQYTELSGSQKKQLLLSTMSDVVETQQLSDENKQFVKRVLAISAPNAIDAFCFAYKQGRQTANECFSFKRLFRKKK